MVVRPGNHVRTVGGEEVYTCSQCGRDKLWVNRATGKGYCFFCREGVKVGEGGAFSPPDTPLRSLPSFHRLDGKSYQLAKGRLVFPCLALVDGNFPLKRAMPEDSPVIPLELQGETCGFVRYCGEHGEPKYRTHGKRGVSLALKPLAESLIICEGYFDYLSLYVALKGERVSLVYLAGNGCTSEQLEEVLAVSGIRRVIVAFDNDRISVAKALGKSLSLYGETLVRCCPTNWGKDFDDAVTAGKDVVDWLLH